jgi:DNA modification methylase
LWLNLGDSYNSAPAGNKTPCGFSQTRPSRRTGNGDQETVNTGRQLVAGMKQKDLIGIPWAVAFALRADGWYLRQDIIWSKPNPMPESVQDRCTKAHEYLFLLSKSPTYFCDMAAIAEAAQDGAKRFNGSPAYKAELGGIFAGKDDSAADTRNKRSVWTVATQPFKEAHFATFPPDLIEPCIKAGCPVGGTVLDPFGGAGTTGLVADRHQRDAILIELNPAYADMARSRISGDAPLFAEVA